jgi:hypothetical protein
MRKVIFLAILVFLVSLPAAAGDQDREWFRFSLSYNADDNYDFSPSPVRYLKSEVLSIYEILGFPYSIYYEDFGNQGWFWVSRAIPYGVHDEASLAETAMTTVTGMRRGISFTVEFTPFKKFSDVWMFLGYSSSKIGISTVEGREKVDFIDVDYEYYPDWGEFYYDVNLERSTILTAISSNIFLHNFRTGLRYRLRLDPKGRLYTTYAVGADIWHAFHRLSKTIERGRSTNPWVGGNNVFFGKYSEGEVEREFMVRAFFQGGLEVALFKVEETKVWLGASLTFFSKEGKINFKNGLYNPIIDESWNMNLNPAVFRIHLSFSY